MSLRVTNNMMVSTLNRNLQTNLKDMEKLQAQLSSGKRINKPSDDPVGINYSLRTRTGLVENEQYQRNVTDAMSWLETTDGVLGEAGDTLQRVRELAVKAANGTNNKESLDAIAEEVKQLKEHLREIGNTTYNGKYVFSGTATSVQAYTGSSPVVWNGNSEKIKYEIGVGVKVDINVAGSEVFGDNADNVFQVLDQLDTNLANEDFAAISGQLSDVDKWIDRNLSTRAEVGARVNRLELAENRLVDGKINFEKLLSENEDVDMAELITRLTTQESVYRASLSAGARIVQPTLVDFLR